MKRGLFVILVGVTLIGMMAGCILRPTKKMQTWIGHHKSELIGTYGAPTGIASDGKGGEILIYTRCSESSYSSGTATPKSYGGYTYGGTTSRKERCKHKMYFCDSKGYIYKALRRWD